MKLDRIGGSTKMNQIRAYFSHSIRGAKRLEATREDMKRNCDEALVIANEIRRNYPEINLWVPAEHEEMVLVGFEKGILNEDRILAIDCGLLLKRDLLIVFRKNGLISNGMQVEINFAETNNIPTVYLNMDDDLLFDPADLELLKNTVEEILEKKS